MITLDYNSTFRHQIEDVNKSRRKINFFFNKPLTIIGQWMKTLLKNLTQKAIIKINLRLTSQLLSSKGLLADLQSKADYFQGKDLSAFINQVDNLILQHISFNDDIEKIIEADNQELFPEIKTTDSLLKETIEVQYDILRILKRFHKKSTKETSDLAIESSRRSLISLETIVNGRRTT